MEVYRLGSLTKRDHTILESIEWDGRPVDSKLPVSFILPARMAGIFICFRGWDFLDGLGAYAFGRYAPGLGRAGDGEPCEKNWPSTSGAMYVWPVFFAHRLFCSERWIFQHDLGRGMDSLGIQVHQ